MDHEIAVRAEAIEHRSRLLSKELKTVIVVRSAGLSVSRHSRSTWHRPHGTPNNLNGHPAPTARQSDPIALFLAWVSRPPCRVRRARSLLMTPGEPTGAQKKVSTATL